MRYTIGIDLGSTTTKAVVMGEVPPSALKLVGDGIERRGR